MGEIVVFYSPEEREGTFALLCLFPRLPFRLILVMTKIPLLLFLVSALAVGTCVAETFCNDNYNTNVKKQSAWCAYYSASDLMVSSSNTFLRAESDNWYAHASIYISSYLSIDSRATQVFTCEPNDFSGNSCSSNSGYFSYQYSSFKYVMICLECHFWLDSCQFDYFDICTAQIPSYGYIPCDTCN